jgi:hypothetical protein
VSTADQVRAALRKVGREAAQDDAERAAFDKLADIISEPAASRLRGMFRP